MSIITIILIVTISFRWPGMEGILDEFHFIISLPVVQNFTGLVVTIRRNYSRWFTSNEIALGWAMLVAKSCTRCAANVSAFHSISHYYGSGLKVEQPMYKQRFQQQLQLQYSSVAGLF